MNFVGLPSEDEEYGDGDSDGQNGQRVSGDVDVDEPRVLLDNQSNLKPSSEVQRRKQNTRIINNLTAIIVPTMVQELDQELVNHH